MVKLPSLDLLVVKTHTQHIKPDISFKKQRLHPDGASEYEVNRSVGREESHNNISNKVEQDGLVMQEIREGVMDDEGKATT